MGAYLDLPAENAGLKEWYDDQKVENLAYDDNPFFAMVKKEESATGKYVPIPIIYEVSQGRSANFTNAQANQTPMQLAEPLLVLRSDYSVATIGHQAALAAADSKGGFLNFAKKFIDIAVQSATLSACSKLFRSGTGSVAQISSITAGGAITLTNPADIVQFGVNQTLQANSADGGTPRAALGYSLSRAINGTLTVSATSLGGAAGQPSGWQANDFLLVQGDNNAAMSGLNAWLPTTNPTTFDNYYGMNRSVDYRLYGVQYNGQSQMVEEAVIDHSILLAREKGKPRHQILNPGTYSAFLKAIGSRREFVDFSTEGGVDMRGLRIQGGSGPIDCFLDRNCQAAAGYMLTLPSWTLYSLKPVPHIFDWGDGLEVLRLGNADAYECRVGYFCNLGCDAPAWNGSQQFSV